MCCAWREGGASNLTSRAGGRSLGGRRARRGSGSGTGRSLSSPVSTHVNPLRSRDLAVCPHEREAGRKVREKGIIREEKTVMLELGRPIETELPGADGRAAF